MSGEIPTYIAELHAARVSSVQPGIMHNATPQLLTAGAHQIIYTCFYGHEELIFEAVPNEIPLALTASWESVPVFYLASGAYL